jgi:O-antigen/teichoic acid export membrane protein
MFAKAKYLAAASAVEYGFQLLVPIYLVRVLSEADFASYRFMWLLIGTLVGAAFLHLPASLTYFIPRNPPSAQRAFIAQTVAFTALVGLAACIALLAFAEGLPGASMARLLPSPLPVFGAVVVLLCATAAMDHVGTARADVKSQAGLNLASALVRAACVVAGASFGTIGAICWALVAFALFRLTLFALYVARSTDRSAGDTLGWRRFKQQFLYAAPFGLASAFWMFRSQAEQWIGAAMLSHGDYASLSVAAAVLPLLAIVQQSLTASSVAELNRLEAKGDVAAMVALNATSNRIALAWLCPLVVFLFVASQPLVELVYTSSYAQAALVLKLLCIGFIGGCIEVSSLAKALRMHREVLRFDATMLVVSVALSLLGAWQFGLMGVVAGSITGRFASTAYFMTVLSRRTQLPVSRMQHWSVMSHCLAAAMLGGALSWLLLSGPASSWPDVVKIALAAGVIAVTYLGYARAMRLPLFRSPVRRRTAPHRSGVGTLTAPGPL